MRLFLFRLAVGLLSVLLLSGELAASTPDNARRKELNNRLEKLEELLKSSGDYQTYVLLDTAARTALDLNYYKKSFKLANNLIRISSKYKNDWNYGTALHNAHIVLGKVALVHDDMKRAKRHLLAAGAVPGTKNLDKTGPDLYLANDLLKKNEIIVVVNYLQLRRKFWLSGKQKLNNWMISLGKGEKPDLLAKAR